MISENPLDKKVFQDDLDFKTLENILETLDHVTPKKVSRQEYNKLNGNFLVELPGDKFGKSYDLFLPDDLVHGELLHLIDFLSRKFGIENYTPYDRIFTQTKVMVGVILRGVNGEEELKNLALKYNISDDFVKRILEHKTNFGETRNFLRRIKEKRKYNGKIGSDKENITLGFEELKDLFGEEFDLTFFRKGVNILRLGMMTITQAEQEGIMTSEIEFFDYISFRKHTKDLDEEEILLREKVKIDELREELNNARKSKNQEKINKAEIKATNIILENLGYFPYQFRRRNYGYQPSKIKRYKEIYCVGFSLIGHSLLSELGINHNGLYIPGHSALEVIIGGRGYYFDGTYSPEIEVIEYGEKQGNYTTFKTENLKEKKAIIGNPEKILLAHIYGNKGEHLGRQGKYEEAIKMYIKAINLIPSNSYYYQLGSFFRKTGRIKEAIEIFKEAINENPNNADYYYNLGSFLSSIGNYEEANKYFDIAISLNPKNEEYYLKKASILKNIGKEKICEIYYYATACILWKDTKFKNKEEEKIKHLIDSQDFNGLRLYLLELEQEDN